MRRFLILLSVLFAFVPVSVWAQTIAPIPHPRIDRSESVSDEFSAVVVDPAELEPTVVEEPVAPIVTGPPQPITLSAKISEDGAIIPNGLIWRVFDTKTDDDGQLALLEKSEDSVAVFNLTPGEYVVHVAYGRSQASDTIRVDPAPSSKTIVLDSGALRLNAAISGDIPIQPSDLSFDISTSNDGQQEGVLIVKDAPPGALLYLNAGVYQVVSRFGDINAQVRAELRVDPGQITEATLYHRAGQISFKLVSESGGEAIADVDWTIKSDDGAIVFSSFGAFPATILAEGDYVVLAKRGQRVYNRDFHVRAGPSHEIEVLTEVY